MAELTLNVDEVVGIKKEIEEGSLELIFNALQSDIYSYPIKSFVRETISNGLDSIIEKNVFREIQKGIPVETFFLQRQDGALLKDSEYNSDYYDEKFLSDNCKVLVTYQEGTPRDSISIMDYGVGLGGERLRGYFRIGWSSKRNFLTARGLYGLGSKSALATGVEYYTMTTVYNGYKTTFMIYNRDYENITPKTKDGKTDVWEVTMADNRKVKKNIYWEPCPYEKNSVTVSVEVKKHNKQTFISGVKDQFQYFSGQVQLKVVDSYGSVTWDYLNDVPEYESDHLLIPKYSTYSSPHILVDGISYGLVSWSELELEDRQGKIALKVSANQVDITQSRESLKWTDKTKSTILKVIKLAEDEASEYVRNNVNIEDVENIFELNSNFNALGGNSNVVTNVFGRFLKLHSIKPKYTLKLDLKKRDEKEQVIEYVEDVTGVINSELFEFLFYSYDFKLVHTYSDNKGLKIKSEIVKDFSSIANKKIVFSENSNLGPKLANKILNQMNTSSFIYVRENVTRMKQWIGLKDTKDYPTEVVKKYAQNILTKYNDIYLDIYEAFDDDEDEITDNELENNLVNLAQVRKLNKEVMWYEYDTYESYGNEFSFRRSKHEIKIVELETFFKRKEVIVVPSSYLKLAKMLYTVDYILETINKPTIVIVAEENVKYFVEAGGIHITNYLRTLNLNTGELMIGEKFVQMNTLIQFEKIMDKYKLFSNDINIIKTISNIDSVKYSKLYNSRSYTIKDLLSRATDEETVNEIIAYLDTLSKFQEIVESKDKDAIIEKSKEMFGTDKIHSIYAYDKDYIDEIEAELERLSPIGPLINDLNTYISAETSSLLKKLLKTIHSND